MKSFERVRVPHEVFGNKTSLLAGKKLAFYGVTKCVVVTDKGIVDLGMLDPILETIKAEGIEYMVYDKVQPDPPDTGCIDCAQAIKEFGADGLLAVGGGSPMDTAKAASLIANFDEMPDDLMEYGAFGTKMKASYNRNVKFICIPTTAGTGAESTPSAVITATKHNIKFSFMNENLIPDMAIIDPALTLGMPARLTAINGFDILAHSMENLIGTIQNEIQRLLALDCVERTWRWLPIAIENPNDLEAREQLSWSAHVCMTTTGIPAGHSVSHAIGSIYHVVHGHACAMVLPTEFRHFAETSQEAIALIADRIGVPTVGCAVTDANRVADAILKYYKSFGFSPLKETLKQMGHLPDKETFIKEMIPVVKTDAKSATFLPPIHEDDAAMAKFCEKIYDEE